MQLSPRRTGHVPPPLAPLSADQRSIRDRQTARNSETPLGCPSKFRKRAIMIFYNPEDAERHGGQSIDRYYFDSINTRNCSAGLLGRTHTVLIPMQLSGLLS